MQITTYYITHKPSGLVDADTLAAIDLLNDTSFGNGDNRSWNAMRAQLDAILDAQTQERLGIAIDAEQSEADDD